MDQLHLYSPTVTTGLSRETVLWSLSKNEFGNLVLEGLHLGTKLVTCPAVLTGLFVCTGLVASKGVFEKPVRKICFLLLNEFILVKDSQQRHTIILHHQSDQMSAHVLKWPRTRDENSATPFAVVVINSLWPDSYFQRKLIPLKDLIL